MCEPNEHHRTALQQLSATTGCRYFPLALGGSEGTADFYRMATDTLSSLVNHTALYTGEAAPTVAQVQVTTLDHLMQQEGVTRIDLLKIDVEGFEYEVLKGCRGLLESGAIRAIQFEFGRAQIVSRCFLKDFFDLLGKQYTLHRVLKDGITPALSYNSRLEIFQTTNFLALLRQADEASHPGVNACP